MWLWLFICDPDHVLFNYQTLLTSNATAQKTDASADIISRYELTSVYISTLDKSYFIRTDDFTGNETAHASHVLCICDWDLKCLNMNLSPFSSDLQTAQHMDSTVFWKGLDEMFATNWQSGLWSQVHRPCGPLKHNHRKRINAVFRLVLKIVGPVS